MFKLSNMLRTYMTVASVPLCGALSGLFTKKAAGYMHYPFGPVPAIETPTSEYRTQQLGDGRVAYTRLKP